MPTLQADSKDVASELRISWSGLRTHEECRMRGKLTRAGKKSPMQDIRMFFPGTVVDLAMRDWLNTPDHPEGGMQDQIHQIMDAEEEKVRAGDGVLKWRHAKDRDEVRSFCVELVSRLEPILRELVTPFDFEPAKRFQTRIQIPDLDGNPTPIWLVGEMDILVRDDQSQWGIWDLKGTRDNDYWRKTIGQLTFYDVAVGAMFEGQHSSRAGLIQPMCTERVKHVTISDQDRMTLMSRVVHMAHDIWRKDFTFRTDSEGCFHPPCPVKHACPRFHVKRPTRVTVSEMREIAANPVYTV